VAPAIPSAIQAYVPQPGQSANVNLNDLAAINPCPANNCWYSRSSKQQAPWRNWNGAAWAHGFSPYGALAFWGGGHGGGDDVGLTVFDFSTGLWSRIGPDNPAAQYSGADGESGLDPVFYDYLHEGSYIVPALHTYNYPAYVPPNLPGSGPKGSWLMPQLVGGTKSGAIPHAVNLETGEWTRFSNGRGISGQSPYAGSIEDTRRNRVYWAAISGATLNMLNLNEVHPRSIQQVPILPRGTIFVHGGYYARHVYVPESDMAVGFWCRYQETLLRSEVLDLSPGTPVSRGAPALPEMNTLLGPGFGVDWCTHTQAFYFYEGRGSTRVLKLKPSSLEFHECSWAWTEEVFADPVFDVPSSGGGSQPFSRWRYVPWLRCFAWSDGPNCKGTVADGVARYGIMQLWRPQGT
jgi:hypothetical protein